MDRNPPNAYQRVLAALIKEDHLDRHIRRIRGVYADRRARTIETIGRLLPEEVAWLQPSDQGIHLVLWLGGGVDDRSVASLAAERGVAVRAVSPVYSGGNGPMGLMPGLGGFGDEEIETATRCLATTIGTVAKAPRSANPPRKETGSK
ncbi:hypothetical protein [Paraburkholderia azotifigens]|uniref:Aminotransferase class I/II-fold pyridoxal phosphate-dependent enzyme n=1 Tax=Paraburkholderia azotifigens TaxID=2057004 RepID=A0A5C6VIS5_9BURK|nr:hypothetical protein [Paraburkholderia azotifigens]TXC85502.1 hypothetical protein FRZ40_16890 [Paraburkholderia azotifigens]